MISVKNLSGFVSVNADGSWVCEGGSKHKAEHLPDPVSHSSNSSFLLTEFSILLPFFFINGDSAWKCCELHLYEAITCIRDLFK